MVGTPTELPYPEMPATTPSVSHRVRASSRVPKNNGSIERDGPGSHGEDVTEDAPHPGGRALIGLDGGGVVVALDAQGDGDAVTRIDDPGVLTRPNEHVGPLCRESLEVQA